MLFTKNYRGFNRININYKLVIIILCIFIVSLLNLRFIFVEATHYKNTNLSENTSYKQNVNYETNLKFLLNPNSVDYKYHFDKYITNVYVKRKMDLFIKEYGNEIFIYYKTKLDKITE